MTPDEIAFRMAYIQRQAEAYALQFPEQVRPIADLLNGFAADVAAFLINQEAV